MAIDEISDEYNDMGYYSTFSFEPSTSLWNGMKVCQYSNNKGYAFAQKIVNGGRVSLMGFDSGDFSADAYNNVERDTTDYYNDFTSQNDKYEHDSYEQNKRESDKSKNWEFGGKYNIYAEKDSKDGFSAGGNLELYSKDKDGKSNAHVDLDIKVNDHGDYRGKVSAGGEF